MTTNIEFLPQGDQKLSTMQPADLTRGQLFALTYAFTLRRCMTQAAISDLIELFNAALPGFYLQTYTILRKLQMQRKHCKLMYTARIAMNTFVSLTLVQSNQMSVYVKKIVHAVVTVFFMMI